MFRNNQAEFNQTYWELIKRVHSNSPKLNIFLYVIISIQTNVLYTAVEICDYSYQIKKQ